VSEFMQVLGIVGTVIGFVTIIAGVVVLARASYARAQMEQLRQHNADLSAREAFLDKEVLRLTAEKKAAEAARDIATEMVTQRADLETHHAQVMKNHQRIFGLLDFITRLIEEVLTHVGKRS
jgi:outer membrane murein-binding lipoprotein Lpp